MSRWFRHYAGMMRDDKLVRVAIRSKQPIERVLWVWGAILESAAEIDEDGRYDFDAAEASYFLRADEADINSISDALASAGRLDGDRVVHWSNRQFSSDRSKERVAAHRARKKAEKADDNGKPTVTEGDSNDDVTLQQRHCIAPETETELEKEDSVANATGTVVPIKATDFCKAVFDSGVSLLTHSGRTPQQARSIIGRWRKTCGDAELLTLIRQAENDAVSEPVEWLTAAVETRNGKRTRARDPLLDALDAAIAEERAERDQAPDIGTWTALPPAGTG